MENCTRFDRHKIFNEEDRTAVLNCLHNDDKLPHEIVNSLYGLFDGYLYSDLLEKTYGKLCRSNYEGLLKVVEKINNQQ